MSFAGVFEEVEDPRDHTVRHTLTEILFVALAAILCGAVHCTEYSLFARGRLDLLRRFVPLEHGAPSHDTFSRVLAALDPAAFESAFRRFMAGFGEEVRKSLPRDQLALDGKSLRRAYEKGSAHMPPLMVTVFNCDTFMSVAQVLADGGNEAEAAIKALKLLSLKGLTVTGDALHCHRKMTETIRAGGGHYVLAIKGNQSKLAKEAAAALDKAAHDPTTRMHQSEETGHDRHELRRAFVAPFKQSPGKAALAGLVAVGRVESWRSAGGKTVHTVRTFALSRKMSGTELLSTVRRHWFIENKLHWQLDVLLGEDDVRTRKNNAPANQAILRRLALNILRAEPQNIPLSHKRLLARWNDDNLVDLFTYMR